MKERETNTRNLGNQKRRIEEATKPSKEDGRKGVIKQNPQLPRTGGGSGVLPLQVPPSETSVYCGGGCGCLGSQGDERKGPKGAWKGGGKGDEFKTPSERKATGEYKSRKEAMVKRGTQETHDRREKRGGSSTERQGSLAPNQLPSRLVSGQRNKRGENRSGGGIPLGGGTGHRAQVTRLDDGVRNGRQEDQTERTERIHRTLATARASLISKVNAKKNRATQIEEK